MKLVSKDYFRLSSIILLLALTISLVSPSAMAMPGLGTGTIPSVPVEGQVVNLVLTGSFVAPHNLVSIRVFEPGLNPTSAFLDHEAPATNPCTADSVMPDSNGVMRAWDLMHEGVVAQFMITAPGDMLSITFGTGAGTETVLYNGVTILPDNISDAGIGPYQWKQTEASPSPGTADDTTNIETILPNAFTFIDCGIESGASPAFFDDHVFATMKPIGGFTLMSPLAQMNNGTVASEVLCNEGLQLMIKSSDGSAACVKTTSVDRLIERGWGTLV